MIVEENFAVVHPKLAEFVEFKQTLLVIRCEE